VCAVFGKYWKYWFSGIIAFILGYTCFLIGTMVGGTPDSLPLDLAQYVGHDLPTVELRDWRGATVEELEAMIRILRQWDTLVYTHDVPADIFWFNAAGKSFDLNFIFIERLYLVYTLFMVDYIYYLYYWDRLISIILQHLNVAVENFNYNYEIRDNKRHTYDLIITWVQMLCIAIFTIWARGVKPKNICRNIMCIN